MVIELTESQWIYILSDSRPLLCWGTSGPNRFSISIIRYPAVSGKNKKSALMMRICRLRPNRSGIKRGFLRNAVRLLLFDFEIDIFS